MPHVLRLFFARSEDGIGALVSLDEEHFYAIVEHHELTLEAEEASEAQAISYARQILEASNASKEVDFDDLLYFAVLKGVRLPTFDWVFVDEAQDTNIIQRAILRKILARGGRLVAVGDPAQAIYGFRGADSDSMDLIANDFAPCTQLPLSVTYRCATKITELAQQYVPAIEAREGAPEGEILNHGTEWKFEQLGKKDLVVCRNTKPLIDLAFRCFRARIPAFVMGKELGEGLQSLIRKCDKRGGGIDGFVSRLEAWRDREVEKAVAKHLEAKAEAIEDKAATLLMLVAELPEANRTVAELSSVLHVLFSDPGNALTLATIHKSKGLEADTVWWLEPGLCPSRWAKSEWQVAQERNLMYVATTRAKTSLRFIDLPKKGGQK